MPKKKINRLLATSVQLGLGTTVLENISKTTGTPNYGAAGLSIASMAPTIQGANIALGSLKLLDKSRRRRRR